MRWDLEGTISSGYLAGCSHPFFVSIRIQFSASYFMLPQSGVTRCGNFTPNWRFSKSFGSRIDPIGALGFKLRVSNVGSPACDNNVWVKRIHHSWAVFVVDDVTVYFLSLFTFHYHFLLFSCYWPRPVPYIYLTLPLTLPYLISYLTLRFAFCYLPLHLTLPYFLPNLTISLTLHFALPYLTS